MSYSIEIALTLLPAVQPAANQHWRVRQKERKQIALLLHFCVAGQKPEKPLERARVVCTRHSSVEPDYDNLAYSFKAVLDAIVREGILVDDQPSVIGKPDYHWRKAPPKQGYVSVTVEEIEE